MSDEARISAKIVLTLDYIEGGGHVTLPLLEGTAISCTCGWSEPMPGAGVNLVDFYGYALGWCEHAAYAHRKVCPRMA